MVIEMTKRLRDAITGLDREALEILFRLYLRHLMMSDFISTHSPWRAPAPSAVEGRLGTRGECIVPPGGVLEPIDCEPRARL